MIKNKVLPILRKAKQKIVQNKEKLSEKKEIDKLLKQFDDVFYSCKKFNSSWLTFTPSHIKKTSYGYSCRIYIPNGLCFEDLESVKKYIESNMSCIFQYEIPDHRQFVLAKIIKPDLVKCNETPFTPYKVKPYELYAGVDVSGKPIIFDVNITPQTLLAGQTRRGKNGSLDHILCSFINSCKPNEVELYLFQCAKTDLIKYSKSRLTRSCTIGDLEEMDMILDYILKETNRRGELLKGMVESFKGDNLLHYNKLNPNSPLPYIYIVIDEFIELMVKSECGTEQDFKKSILQKLGKIAQWGGSYGINYIICHQKPEKALMPTFLKNMSSVRICFGFDDAICSEIVLGNRLAHNLPPRRAYYSSSIGSGLLYTTNLQGKIEPIVKRNSVKNPYYLTDELKNPPVCREIKTPRKFTKRITEKKNNFAEEDFAKVNGRQVDLNKKTEMPQFEYKPIDKSKVKIIDQRDEVIEALTQDNKDWRRKVND